MYNMTTVDEHEGIPEEFEKETDFFLPDGEFGELIQQKQVCIYKGQSDLLYFIGFGEA